MLTPLGVGTVHLSSHPEEAQAMWLLESAGYYHHIAPLLSVAGRAVGGSVSRSELLDFATTPFGKFGFLPDNLLTQ